MTGKEEELQKIRKDVEELVRKYFAGAKYEGITPVRYGGSWHDEKELIAMINAILDGWWVNGRHTKEFENVFKNYLGARHAVFCNSGSSALILAFEALGLPKGSEIISPALTFPTTINPAIRQGMKIVLVDSDIGTYNVNVDELEKAVTSDTRAIIIPHLLGNMSDMDRITDLVEDHNLLFVEDCCESLGSMYNNKLLGSFGDTAAFSFFPSHHISAAGGGMFTTSSEDLYTKALSLKNWGRQYSNVEFIPNPGLIRSDYIQQYTYEEIGYNLNASEIEAAKGVVQMQKLEGFNKIRETNFALLTKFFSKYRDYFVLPRIANSRARPSWFAFPLTMTEEAKKRFTREQLMDFLFSRKIESRYILAGNIAKQPAYSRIPFRLASGLENSNAIFSDAFFIGVSPGISKERMKYLQESFEEFLSGDVGHGTQN